MVISNHSIVARPAEECLDTADGTTYSGLVAMTESGYYCKSWIPNTVSSWHGLSICALRCDNILLHRVFNPDNRMSSM